MSFKSVGIATSLVAILIVAGYIFSNQASNGDDTEQRLTIKQIASRIGQKTNKFLKHDVKNFVCGNWGRKISSRCRIIANAGNICESDTEAWPDCAFAQMPHKYSKKSKPPQPTTQKKRRSPNRGDRRISDRPPDKRYLKYPSENIFTPTTVYFATDRKRTHNTNIWPYFSGLRAVKNDSSHSVTYGSLRVTVPTERTIGSIPRPNPLLQSIWKFFGKNAEKPAIHITINQINHPSKTQWYELVNRSIVTSRQISNGCVVLVFIHGFANTFDYSAYSAAQIGTDLKFNGPIISFFWPSDGEITKDAYIADQTDLEWALPDLQDFLIDVAKNLKADKICLLGHSLGGRAILMTMGDVLRISSAARHKYSRVILAAPDADADKTRTEYAPDIVKRSPHVTIYSSRKDLAIKYAREVHRSDRAGGGIQIFDGVETIDATGFETDLVGHSLFNSPAVIRDMSGIIHDGRSADERNSSLDGRYRDGSGKKYWSLR